MPADLEASGEPVTTACSNWWNWVSFIIFCDTRLYLPAFRQSEHFLATTQAWADKMGRATELAHAIVDDQAMRSQVFTCRVSSPLSTKQHRNVIIFAINHIDCAPYLTGEYYRRPINRTAGAASGVLEPHILRPNSPEGKVMLELLLGRSSTMSTTNAAGDPAAPPFARGIVDAMDPLLWHGQLPGARGTTTVDRKSVV